MSKNEKFLQMLWTNDSIDMSMADLLRAIKCNGFRLVRMTSQRLYLEALQ
jgi:hypothetical protein